MTERQKAYRVFLNGELWKSISAQKKTEVPLCENCGQTEELQSHHVHYPDRWEDTRMEDLKVLCRTCHRIEHGLPVASPFSLAFRALQKKVNQSESASDLPKMGELRSVARMAVMECDEREIQGLLRLIARWRIRSNPGIPRLWQWSRNLFEKLSQTKPNQQP